VGDVGPTVAGAGPTTAERRRIYAASSQGDRLWQGEILSDLPQTRLSLESLPATKTNVGESGDKQPIKVEYEEHPLIVVLSQDCDLEKDYKRRQSGGRPFLLNVLLCDVHEAEALRQKLSTEESTGSKEWRVIKENGTPRFQFLSKVLLDQDASGLGLPSLAVDFRSYFTVRTDELYERLKLKLSIKRCKLQTPYAEHLGHRFHHFQSSIPLTVEHPTA